MNDQKLADDTLYGAAAIADELGLPLSEVYYLARMKRLPIGKLGKILVARRSTLRRAMDQITRGQ